MPDPRVTNLARVLVEYSTRVKPGDLVAVTADPLGMPLVEAIFERVLRAGGHPVWIGRCETLAELQMAHGSDDQLAFVSPLDLHRMETIDVSINLWVERNTRAMGAVDPARLARASAARKPILQAFMDRTASGSMRWCGTLYPTEAAAQDAEMSLRAYEDFVYGAGLLDAPDPITAWRAIHERQERVREWLQQRGELHFFVEPNNGHDGTDLRVDVDPSKSIWINCAGTENFPDGEVFTGPQGVSGHVNYSFPAVHHGRAVEGVRLAFRDGRVVDASATKNEAYLIEMLDQDAGARGLGEIAVGTNYQIKDFSRNTLFDEKIGGTFHAAVGAGYPESGSSNESALHWDMVCDLRPAADGSRPGGTITADGEAFSKDGVFQFKGWPGPG